MPPDPLSTRTPSNAMPTYIVHLLPDHLKSGGYGPAQTAWQLNYCATLSQLLLTAIPEQQSCSMYSALCSTFLEATGLYRM